MDEMGKRMDELEHSIVELMEQAGLDRDALLPTAAAATTSSSVATAEIWSNIAIYFAVAMHVRVIHLITV